MDKDETIVPYYYMYYFRQMKLQVIHTRLRLNCNSLASEAPENQISANANFLFLQRYETAEYDIPYCNNFDYIRLQTINSLGIAVNASILLKVCTLYDDITNRDIFSVM